MLLGFDYLYNSVMFYFLLFSQKAENNKLKKSQLTKFLLYYFFVFA